MKEIKVKIPTLDDVLPREFKEHMANAYKEVLLAFRCLIDEKIKRIDEKKLKKIEIK